jgi:hypothetical protein
VDLDLANEIKTALAAAVLMFCAAIADALYNNAEDGLLSRRKRQILRRAATERDPA